MQTKYTVVKEGGKWWVMDFVNPLTNDKGTYAVNKLPTLPEHSDYWSKMEGKVIEEGEFEVELCGKRMANENTSFEKYAFPKRIPKQESQEDLWDVAIAEARQIADGYFPAERDWFEDWLNEYHDFFKQHFTITRK